MAAPVRSPEIPPLPEALRTALVGMPIEAQQRALDLMRRASEARFGGRGASIPRISGEEILELRFTQATVRPLVEQSRSRSSWRWILDLPGLMRCATALGVLDDTCDRAFRATRAMEQQSSFDQALLAAVVQTAVLDQEALAGRVHSLEQQLEERTAELAAYRTEGTSRREQMAASTAVVGEMAELKRSRALLLGQIHHANQLNRCTMVFALAMTLLASAATTLVIREGHFKF